MICICYYERHLTASHHRRRPRTHYHAPSLTSSPPSLTATPHPPTAEDAGATADVARPPTLLDKKMFSQNIYNISSEDLGRVVQILDARCEACIKKIDPDDIEIDIDTIDSATFWTVDTYVKECLPGTKKGAGAKKASLGGGGKPAGGDAAAAGKASKKARVG